MYDDQDEEQRQPSIRDRFPTMRPIDQVPTILQVAGCGLGMSGARDADMETGSFVSSHCLTLLFVPVWALAAYRVQRTPRGGGYYFLGRVPLSLFAWASNGLMACVFLVLTSVGGWWLATGGSDARAAAHLDDAARLAEEGRLQEAATLLRDVMDGRTSHAGEARLRLAALARDLKGPHVEVTGLFRILADLESRGDPVLPPPDLFKRGYAYAEKCKNPAEGLEMTEIIAPYFVLDSAELLPLERRLLEALLKVKPGDPELVSRLAVVLDAQGHASEAEKLVMPVIDKLGSLPGAAIAGRLRLRQGRYADARALLHRVVEARLPSYRTLTLVMQEAQIAVWRKCYAAIDSRQAAGFDYAKYDAADKEGKDKIILEYVNRIWPDEHRVRVATHAVDRERLTLQAVMDLGLSEVHLAQKEADPTARRLGLEQAERTFKSVQEAAKRNDSYRLRLAQVSYWLGKRAEGRKLLDEVMRDRKHAWRVVSEVAAKLREVGEVTEARTILETAYAREKNPFDKERIAYVRSLSAFDLDDRLLWLGRSGNGDQEVRLSRLLMGAQKARLEGKDDKAITLCRDALVIYKGMPDSPATFNNSALVYSQLYDLTRDKADFLAGVSRLEKALALLPNDTVILSNVASAMRDVAASETIDGLDFKALRQRPSSSHLGYLYDDEAGRTRWLGKFAARPAVARMRGQFERLLVLSPSLVSAYSQLGSLHELLREREPMARLLRRAKGAVLDTADSVREANLALSGKKDDKRREEARQSIRHYEKALVECRTLGGATHAVAACTLANRLIGLALLDSTVDPDRVVELAEEGHAASASDATRSALAGALLFRAHDRLKKDVPEYALLAKRLERGIGTRLVSWLLLKGGPMAAKTQADPDVKRAQSIRAEQVRRVPSERGAATWALLKQSHPKEAGKIAELLRKNEVTADNTALEVLLAPQSAGVVLDRVLVLELLGKPEDAAKLLAAKKAAGVPLPETR